jgi:glutamine synthetase
MRRFRKSLSRLSRSTEVIFNGNGYSEAWHIEAEKRGLPNLRSCVEALPLLGSKETTELFEHYGVLTARELHSRMDVYLEQYSLHVSLKARTAIEMAKTIISHRDSLSGELAATRARLKAVGYTFDTDSWIKSPRS